MVAQIGADQGQRAHRPPRGSAAATGGRTNVCLLRDWIDGNGYREWISLATN